MTDPTPIPDPDKFMLPAGVYDKLKFTSMVLLPAVATLYVTLGSIWNWSDVKEVIGSITGVSTFLGLILGRSSRNYKNSDSKYFGMINIINGPDGKKVYSLDLNGEPNELDNKKEVTFKMNTPS